MKKQATVTNCINAPIQQVCNKVPSVYEGNAEFIRKFNIDICDLKHSFLDF